MAFWRSSSTPITRRPQDPRQTRQPVIAVERRLDNVVYRMGFAMTRRQARQLVSHAHFTVNGRKVDIPSYQVKAGDVIEVAESSRSSEIFKAPAGPGCPRVPDPRLDGA